MGNYKLKTIDVTLRMDLKSVSTILILLMCFSFGKCKAKDDFDEMTVARENYGIVFVKQGTMDNAHSVWHQTFVICLEESSVSKPDVYCGNYLSAPPNDTLTLQHFFLAIELYVRQHD